ncbi:MAG: hypothetical protein JXA30_00030 [Deltaproteobacteria bacterium]|nr:hypothetical protein [Deltaproteobacteria bacterium]
MGVNRLFFPQEALDHWMDEERISIEGEIMCLKAEGGRFRLESAVRFISEVGGGGDRLDLLGKVKSVKQLEEIGGELCAGSVIVGDDAYEVVEGFLAELLLDRKPIVSGTSMEAATRAAVGDAVCDDEVDALTRFFRQKR